MKIAYLGDEYSHSYVCASRLKGELVGYPTIRACLGAVANEQCDVSVVPIENSVEGAVNECVDGITELSLYIIGEMEQPIHNCLIGFQNASKVDIRTVYSHPQAISQCRKYIDDELKGVDVVAVSSTSEGLTRITDKSIAAIAGKGHKDQTVLDSDIEDYSNNTTRFVVLSKRPSFEGGKVSIVFDAPNKAGALINVLKVFESLNLNMTKIESRPVKSGLGRYVFYVDFLSDADKQGLFDIMDKLGQKCGFIKFLGKY